MKPQRKGLLKWILDREKRQVYSKLNNCSTWFWQVRGGVSRSGLKGL